MLNTFMFIGTLRVTTKHTRKSKLGKKHAYKRVKTVVQLRCDQCDTVFTRDLKNINKNRLNNNYFHVCSDCEPKKFAQRKGVENKKLWDLSADSEIIISKN